MTSLVTPILVETNKHNINSTFPQLISKVASVTTMAMINTMVSATRQRWMFFAIAITMEPILDLFTLLNDGFRVLDFLMVLRDQASLQQCKPGWTGLVSLRRSKSSRSTGPILYTITPLDGLLMWPNVQLSACPSATTTSQAPSSPREHLSSPMLKSTQEHGTVFAP